MAREPLKKKLPILVKISQTFRTGFLRLAKSQPHLRSCQIEHQQLIWLGRKRNEKQLTFVYLKLWAASLTKRPNTFGLFYSKHTHWTIWLASSWLCICATYVNTYACIKLPYVHLKGHCQVILWLFLFSGFYCLQNLLRSLKIQSFSLLISVLFFLFFF